MFCYTILSSYATAARVLPPRFARRLDEYGWYRVSTEEGLGYVSGDYVTVRTEFRVAESKEEEKERLEREEAERQAAAAAAEAARKAREEEERKAAEAARKTQEEAAKAMERQQTQNAQ